MIGYSLRRADSLMHQHFNRIMRPLKLREVEYSVLLLAAQSGGLSQRALCEGLAMSPPNMVGVLAGLQQRALIERVRSTTDRRVRKVTLTPQGYALLAKSVLRANELDRKLTAGFSDVERHTLLKLLRKIWQTPS